MAAPGDAASVRIIDTEAIRWRAFEDVPGVHFKVLRKHPENGGLTLLLHFEPGTTYPAHRHPAGEEYYVLEGELLDGPRSYGPGTYVEHPPGSVHRPGTTVGATVLVVLPAAIEPV